jgi:predicted  nucleic acid-binding Zn-ribbon protein
MESEIEEANNAIDDLVCLIAELEGEIVAWQKDVDNLELRLSNAVFDLGRST